MVPIGTVPINRDHCGHIGKPFLQVATFSFWAYSLCSSANFASTPRTFYKEGVRGVLAKCRSTTFLAFGLHSTSLFCQKSTSTKFVKIKQQVLDKSTIYNEKQRNKQFKPKSGKIYLQIYTFCGFLSTIYNLQKICPTLSSTIYMF